LDKNKLMRVAKAVDKAPSAIYSLIKELTSQTLFYCSRWSNTLSNREDCHALTMLNCIYLMFG
jgi:hypothetical protein